MKKRQKEMLGSMKRMEQEVDMNLKQLTLLAEKRRPDVFRKLQNLPMNMIGKPNQRVAGSSAPPTQPDFAKKVNPPSQVPSHARFNSSAAGMRASPPVFNIEESIN